MEEQVWVFPARSIMNRFYNRGKAFWEWAECDQPTGVVVPVPHAIANKASRWVDKNIKGWWCWHRVGDDWQVTFKDALDAARFRAEFGV